MIADRVLDWADGRALDHIVALGRLAVRPRRYVDRTAALAGATIAGLQVSVKGQGERALFHAETGVYGFLRLSPGPSRIEVTDAAGRWFPAVRSFVIPDRSAALAALVAGGTPPAEPYGAADVPAWMADIAMRPAIGAPASPGVTTVWGVVRAVDGTPVPLARIAIDTVGGREVVVHSDRNGAYLLPLPAERADPIAGTAVFDRAVRVHVPGATLAAAIRAAQRFVAAFPDDLDTLDPDAAGSPFVVRQFSLVPPGDPAQPSPLPVTAGARSRWDIALLP